MYILCIYYVYIMDIYIYIYIVVIPCKSNSESSPILPIDGWFQSVFTNPIPSPVIESVDGPATSSR